MRCLGPNDFIAAEPPVAIAGDGPIQVWLFASRPVVVPVRPDLRWQPLLAAQLGADPAQLRFGLGEHGKPFLAPPHVLEFNISHSQGTLIAGISRDQPLGIDIEVERRPRPVYDLARRFFTAAEADALERLDPALKQPAFLRLWSCKEAVLKALGIGIGFGLDRLEFAIGEDGVPTGLNVIDASAGSAAEWHIVRLEPARGQFGALAWRGAARDVSAYVTTRPQSVAGPDHCG